MTVIKCVGCGASVNVEAAGCPTCGADPRTGEGAVKPDQSPQAEPGKSLQPEDSSRAVAVFGPTSGAAFAGHSLILSGSQFSIEGVGDVDTGQVAQYERDGLLIWRDQAARDWLLSASPGRGAPEPAIGRSHVVSRIIIVAALILAVAGGVYLYKTFSKSGLAEKTYTIHGELDAPYKNFKSYDIAHASVEVRDQSNELVGSTTSSGYAVGGLMPWVKFTVDVPKRNFYTITVGTHSGPSYSFQDLESLGWKVDLTLK